jgi:hypothetical protein
MDKLTRDILTYNDKDIQARKRKEYEEKSKEENIKNKEWFDRQRKDNIEYYGI